MPHNLKVNYGRASISINSTYDQVGLRVQTSTADHQGQRTEDFSLEIGGPRPNTHALSAPGYLHPDEYLPMASLAREPRDGRMRVTPQQPPPPLPPPLDVYDAVHHDAADHRSYGRSRQSIAFQEPYYWPHERVPTSGRTAPGTGYEYEYEYAYATPAHEPTHGMGGERVQYHHHSARDFESGRIERPSASECLRPPRHSNPSISVTPPTPAPAPRHDASRDSAAYRGSELVRYNHEEAPDGSLAGTPCGSYPYRGDDGGGGVSAQREYAWIEAPYPYSDAEDGSEWSGGVERVGFGGEDGRYR